jgi:pentose-5-phosphate-3-epimerase
VGAGANVLVAGNAIFRGNRSIAENVAAFHVALGGS